jgi:hypothetical protein
MPDAMVDILSLPRRTAIVTGAGQNIGKTIALKLASFGANVTVCGHTNQRNVDAVAAEVRQRGVGALALLLDVGHPAKSRTWWSGPCGRYRRSLPRVPLLEATLTCLQSLVLEPI